MNVETKQRSLFARQPLSAFGKLAGVALLSAAIFSGILALAIGFPDNTSLLIVTASLLVCAGLAVTGFRWMPLLIIATSGIFLYQIAIQPFIAYHLTNPKAGGFLPFVLDVLITACVFVALAASIGAAVQNYRCGERQEPIWFAFTWKGLLTGVVGIVIGAILVGAIGQTGASPATTYTNGVPTVHMSAGNFSQPSVTIAKGAKLLLVDDVAVLHIIANGAWQNGAAKPANEPGAPTVNNVQVNGNSIEIGPFTTAGTYNIYCIVHQGMNLTVIVQ